MSALRHRVTLRVRLRTPLGGLSMMLVVARLLQFHLADLDYLAAHRAARHAHRFGRVGQHLLVLAGGDPVQDRPQHLGGWGRVFPHRLIGGTGAAPPCLRRRHGRFTGGLRPASYPPGLRSMEPDLALGLARCPSPATCSALSRSTVRPSAAGTARWPRRIAPRPSRSLWNHDYGFGMSSSRRLAPLGIEIWRHDSIEAPAAVSAFNYRWDTLPRTRPWNWQRVPPS